MSWEEDCLLGPDHRGAGDAHLADEVLGGLRGGGDGGGVWGGGDFQHPLLLLLLHGGDVQHSAHHHRVQASPSDCGGRHLAEIVKLQVPAQVQVQVY